MRVGGEEIARIGTGLLVLASVGAADTPADAGRLAEKVAGLRVFRDEAGAMNHPVAAAGGAVLAVSNFTLHGDVRRGRRPSFVEAMAPEGAEPLFEAFVTALRERGLPVATGRFGAMMDVALTNDGPVTILLDTARRF